MQRYLVTKRMTIRVIKHASMDAALDNLLTKINTVDNDGKRPLQADIFRSHISKFFLSYVFKIFYHTVSFEEYRCVEYNS